MSANYQAYLNYLSSFADSHSLAVHAETDVYPLFTDIKKLIRYYESSIEKFPNVQNELIKFIEQLEYDRNDFDYYQEKFIGLKKIEGYLQELRAKKITASMSKEIQDFIVHTYSSASLYDVNAIEERVLSYHNKAAETQRHEEQKANTTKFLIGFVLVILLIIYLFSKC